jgi:DNA-binding CsgD family transcriptional regulator
VPVSHDPDSDSQDMLSVNREFADAVLHNGLGQYAEALSAARQAAARDVLGYGSWVLPELIEAAVRSGDSDAARTAFAQLDERTMLSTSAWARGIRARSQALITEGPGAERHYIAAIELLGKSRMVVHHARAHLIYGEWLRRQRRRVDARTSLRMAENMFKSMGAEAFAARADRELLATGERTQKRTGQSTPQLTAQERQIARLAYEGRSNTEIAGQLFISARTVEYHFGKIFSKLGIASRHELTAEHVKDSLVPCPKTKRRHLITPQ